VARGVAEAPDLLGLGEQVRDRVEHEVDERVLARRDGGRHVACDHRERGLVHLGAQPVDHRDRQLDAGDRHAALAQRNGDATGPDGELERAPTTGELDEAIHGRTEHLGCVHPDARCVVARRGVGIPQVFLSQPVHDAHRCGRG
jgi:hypothetical protein